MPHDEAKHPRGQPDNAGQFKSKPPPAPPPASRRSAKSAASADRDHTESCDRMEHPPHYGVEKAPDGSAHPFRCGRCGAPIGHTGRTPAAEAAFRARDQRMEWEETVVTALVREASTRSGLADSSDDDEEDMGRGPIYAQEDALRRRFKAAVRSKDDEWLRSRAENPSLILLDGSPVHN